MHKPDTSSVILRVLLGFAYRECIMLVIIIFNFPKHRLKAILYKWKENSFLLQQFNFFYYYLLLCSSRTHKIEEMQDLFFTVRSTVWIRAEVLDKTQCSLNKIPYNRIWEMNIGEELDPNCTPVLNFQVDFLKN